MHFFEGGGGGGGGGDDNQRSHFTFKSRSDALKKQLLGNSRGTPLCANANYLSDSGIKYWTVHLL